MLPLVHLITLQETPERSQDAQAQLTHYNLPFQVHTFQRQSPGWKGCLSSHLAVFTQFLQTKEEICFICEDNLFAWLPEIPSILLKDLETWYQRDDWDVLFLGGYILRPWSRREFTDCPRIVRTYGYNHGSVCYLIRRKTIEQILHSHQEIPFDILLDSYRTFIHSSFLFIHTSNHASNVNPHQDWWRKIWFSPVITNINRTIFFSPWRREVFLLMVVVLLLYMYKKYKREERRDSEEDSLRLFFADEERSPSNHQ